MKQENGYAAQKVAVVDQFCHSGHVESAMLEKLYKQTPFDYEAALITLEEEAKHQPLGKDFALVDLPSFTEISVAKAENANLKPSIVRARLGKMFNARVKEGDVADVCRSMDGNGNLKFYSRAALYVRLSDKSTIKNEGDIS